jgi:hypothetical protein|tara:strand:+ start:777 stop:1004 length:228 start_codon:yes stop_codon:yes gene_type:complete
MPYHILKIVNYGSRTTSTYHEDTTHTLEEANAILNELNSLASNRPNEDTDDITDSYTIAKDLPVSSQETTTILSE